MGIVVEAHDEQLDRTVAIKLLYPLATRRRRTRLLREAQALARISHPNVVQIYDVGTIGDQMFIAMELVRGRTLARWQREPRPWRATVTHYLQAARGLAAAHAKGVIHRDFKPDNCIVGDDGRVRVLDFGLAREVELTNSTEVPDTSTATNLGIDSRSPTNDALGSPPGLSERLTREGALLGTLLYMSLEQLHGEPADARTDQYAFCASLHEALFGVVPYEAVSPTELISAMTLGQRATPTVQLPARLARALSRGLSLDREERWPSMEALIAELEAIGRRRRWWSATVALGLGVALGGGLVFTGTQQSPCADPEPTMRGTWDADARQRVEDVFTLRGPDDGDDLDTRIIEHLDAYAQQWSDMTHASCQATMVTHEQSDAMFDRRARCLERRFNRFSSAVHALSTSEDTESLVESSILPFKLPGLERCADLDRLLGRHTLRDAPVHDDDARVRRQLDDAHSMREMGHFEDALTLARAARDQASALDSPLLHAEALECIGRIMAEGGPMQGAGPVLERAVVMASRVGDDQLEARAWLSLLYATTMQGTLDDAERQRLGATAAVERANDELLRAWLFNVTGILESENGHFEQAEHDLEQALQLKSRQLGDQHVDVGIAWFNLGMTLSNAGTSTRAHDAISQAKAIFEANVGRHHSLTTYAIAGLCNLEQGRGNSRAALETCARALARIEASPVAPMWEFRVRFAMAAALWDLHRDSEARHMARSAARVIEPEDPGQVQTIERWLNEHQR